MTSCVPKGVQPLFARTPAAFSLEVFWNKVYIGSTMSPSINLSASQFPKLNLEDFDLALLPVRNFGN